MTEKNTVFRVTKNLYKVGNSYAIIIPSGVMEFLDKTQPVEITIKPNKKGGGKVELLQNEG
jgi:antitoxin component of MazEF toxin-antitoxin module